MGKASKLSQRQWDDIGHRTLHGESAAGLAREFKVSKAIVSARFAERNRRIRQVAQMLLDADLALRALSPAEQLAALRLADAHRIACAARHLMARAIGGHFAFRK
jgi:hypothetical protein